MEVKDGDRIYRAMKDGDRIHCAMKDDMFLRMLSPLRTSGAIDSEESTEV